LIRRVKIVNIQKRNSNLNEISYLVKEIPEFKDIDVTHKYAKVDGILSYYNFFNKEPDFNIQTRIFSRQAKFIINLKPKVESSVSQYLKNTTVVLASIGKIKDVKSIRRKRLTIKHKERIANSLLNPNSYLFFRKEFPDINATPVYCESNKG
jgi:hypothetical protein